MLLVAGYHACLPFGGGRSVVAFGRLSRARGGSAGMPLNWFVAAYVGSAVLLTLGLIVEGDRGRPLDSRGLPSAAERE